MNFLKKYGNYFLAFIIPFVICLIFFYFKNVLQRIENIYVTDLRLQHMVFFSYLKNVLLGKASLFYSFSAGMGSSMISTIIFYCLSPVNFLLLLIRDIRYAILFIYITKVSLAGLTMYIFLYNKYQKRQFITVVFSTCYALCSFSISYFFCIFWLDSLYLAPIVLLGIEKMFYQEKINLVYILALAGAIICNIQMGFGLCIFCVIYYFYSFLSRYTIRGDFDKFKQLSILFIISSLCAGAISSGALFGFMSEYNNIAAARSISVSYRAPATNVLYVLKNLFTVGNLKGDYYNNFEPFVYCGLVITFFSILYFFNKNISSKKRIHSFLVIAVFLISFCVPFINLFWHLSSPILLNFRYSVYLGLFLTMIAYESYLSKEKMMKSDIFVLGISLLVGMLMIVCYQKEVYIGYSLIFLVVMFVIILLSKSKNYKRNRIFDFLLCILMLVECGVNGYLSIYTASDIPYDSYTSYKSLKQIVKKRDVDDSYRVMYNYSNTDSCGDTLLLNQHSSLRYFSSVINGNLLKFFEKNYSFLGNNNYRISSNDSPLLLSLLGNKYFYLTKELSDDLYQKVDTISVKTYNYFDLKDKNKKVYVYENPYALSLGYLILKDAKFKKGMDNVDYQNEIIKSFTGIDKDVLVKLEYDVIRDSEECNNSKYYSCLEYHIKNPTDNSNYYVYSMFDEYHFMGDVNLYNDVNKPLLLVSASNHQYLMLEYMGDLENEKFSANTYYKENLISSLKYLQDNMLYDVSYKKNVLNGKIKASRDGILFLSIPYDKHFTVYVDGKKKKYYSLLDNTFMGLDLENGNHSIKIIYNDNRVLLYVISSVVAIFITIIVYYYVNLKIDKEKKRLEELRKLEEIKKNKKSKKKRK